jgi:hypothetical protein
VLAALESAELGLLLGLALALTWLVCTLFPDLTGPASRSGIISLELAWTPARANEIIDAWRKAGRIGRARRSLTVDWAFIACYATTFALLALLAARAAGASGLMADADADGYASTLAPAMVAAAVLDVVENRAMLRILTGGANAGRVLLMSTAAATKLMLLLVGVPLSLVVVAASGVKAIVR